MKEIERYLSSFGWTYVVIEDDDGRRFEVGFPQAPKAGEVDALIAGLLAVPETVVEVEAEDGKIV